MKILITAGPTREYLDPVRFLSNPSTGKMGYAIAQAAQQKGHEVVLVSGPTHLTPPWGIQVFNVKSADQMHKKVLELFDWADGVIMTAAVSDFKPKMKLLQKVKKEGDEVDPLELVRTPDILFELGKDKKGKWLVGFAAESENLLANAQKKLASKNLDMIVANDISQQEAGFEHDTNIVHLLYPDGSEEGLPKMSKSEVAQILIEKIERKFAS